MIDHTKPLLTLQYVPEDLQVVVNGELYDLVKREPPKEPELNTFEDCWNKVKPKFFIDTVNEIMQYGHVTFSEVSQNQLPTERQAKQIQAAIKLFVVRQALQGDWEPESGTVRWHVYYDNLNRTIRTGIGSQWADFNPYSFKTFELAEKSIEIANDIWLEYFGVNQ